MKASDPRAPYISCCPVTRDAVCQQAQYFIANVKAIGYTGQACRRAAACSGLRVGRTNEEMPDRPPNAGISIVRCGAVGGSGVTRSSTTNNNFLKDCGSTVGCSPPHLPLAERLSSTRPADLPRLEHWTCGQYTNKAVVPGVPRQVDRSISTGRLRSQGPRHGGGATTGCTRDVNGDGRDDVVGAVG